MKYIFIIFLAFASCTAHKSLTALDIKQPNNLILIIGDGMGPQQLSLLLLYNEYLKSKGEKPLIIEKFLENSAISLILPKPESAIVTESACAATEMATGKAGTLEGLGINLKGHKLETILEKARSHRKSTGLITDTRITHATPAAFAVHTEHRDNEFSIAKDMLNSNIDILFGGGERYFTPIVGSNKSYRSPNISTSYEVVRNNKELGNLKHLPAIGLFSENEMPDGIKDFYATSDSTVPKYNTLSKKALELISQNENGFFLMIEAGLIDWAGHRNDTGQILYEMIKLNSVVESVLNWAEYRDDTVILLTADHETGSFGFSYKADEIGTELFIPSPQDSRSKWKPPISYIDKNIFNTILKQKLSLNEVMDEIDKIPEDKFQIQNIKKILNNNLPYKFSEKMIRRLIEKELIPKKWNPKEVKKWSAIDDFEDFYPDHKDRRPALLARLISDQQGTVWGSGGHTATLVPLAVYGKKEWKEYFSPLMSTVEFGQKMQKLFFQHDKN